MKIDLTDLFNGSRSELGIDTVLNFGSFVYSGYAPIKDGVCVKGRLYSKADVVYLELNIKFNFYGFCDRCADDIKKKFSFDINKIVVQKLQNENDDDNYIVVENHILDLNELVNEEVSLSLPAKILCNEDCKGLCAQCGTNLNVNECDCKREVDPRLEKLLQLLDE